MNRAEFEKETAGLVGLEGILSLLRTAIVESDLPVRQLQHQTIEFRRDLDLARQPTVSFALGGGAIQQRVLIISNRGQPTDPVVIDINVAGRAHRVAATFRHDATDVVARRRLHRAFALAGLDAFMAPVRMDEGNGWHVASVTLPW